MFTRLRQILTGREQKATDISALLDLGRATAAGIAVSPEAALRCVPAFAAIKVLSETVGSLPLHLYERRPDGGKDRADKHPLYRLLHDRPNPWTDSATFLMELQADALLHGSAFAVATRSGNKILELLRLPPRSTVMKIDDKTLEPNYEVTLRDGARRTYRWEDVLHVSALGGLSPVRQASEAIGLYLAQERHAANLFGNAGRPSVALSFKGKLSADVAERLKKSWKAAHGGEASGGAAVLEEGAEVKQLAFSGVELQFLELRQFQLTEIARAFRVPPILLMDYGRATWSNSAEMSQAFLTFSLLPWLRLWQGAIARLLSAEEQATHFAEFLVDDLVKADVQARFEAYSKAITTGVLSPNEVRAMENRPPYDGGDEFMKPLNMGAPGNTPPTPLPKPRAVA